MNTLHIKKGDTVIILSGTEKGKTGKVLETDPKRNLVVVEGVGMHKKHQRPRKAGQHGQIIEKQHAIRASKVMEVGRHKEKLARKKK
jgi:large subunit ribosomal protein L24